MRAARPHSFPPSRNKGAHAPSHADAHERDDEGNSTACPAGRKANEAGSEHLALSYHRGVCRWAENGICIGNRDSDEDSSR